MEQQEEKKRKEHGRRRRGRQSKSTLSFPIDLTSEILLRLPAKSLERFRCVSKLWSSIITDPYFINLFETRSPRPSLLLCFRKDDNVLVYSIPQHKNSNKSYSSSQPTDRYHMKFPRHGCNSFTESVHGLICFLGFDEKPIVWNPSKRQLLTLPKLPSKMSLRNYIFLGYDPIEGKHKLVCVPANRNCDVYQVLTLGSAQESWRMVKTNHKGHSYPFHTHGRCIKGVIYYLASNYETDVGVIMSFDVRSEIFDMIQLPFDIDNDARMTNYEGKLACVTKKTMKGYSYETITLCILEDAEKHE